MASVAGHVPGENLGDDEKLIRKLRKKLRQIERLELLNRTFSEEEKEKVVSKASVRQQLLSLLAQIASQDVSNAPLKPHHRKSSSSGDEAVNLNSSEETSLTFQHNVSGDGGDIQKDAEMGIVEGVSETEQISCKDVKATEQMEALKEFSGNKEKIPMKKNIAASEMKHEEKVAGKSAKSQHPSPDVPKEKFSRLEKTLISSYVHVTSLESHCDIVTAVIINENTLISASRDTTVKCWNIETGQEVKSLGSHTESVTCLTVLTASDCLNAFPDDNTMPDEPVIISGSCDCTIKLWGMNSGKLLDSIYTFNPVTQVSFFPYAGLLITGSDGGKLELWDIPNKRNAFTTHAYDASVTGIKVEKETLIYSCAANGVIQVHSGSEKGTLKCLFVSDNLKSVLGKPFNLSHIRCVELWNGKMLIGQDTSNIKLVDWKKGVVEKLKNHHSQFSFTDAICCHDDTVVTSTYDLDKGYGSINVRRGPELKYCGTLDDEETERILCIDFLCKSSGQMIIVTGGMELKVWQIFPRSHPKPRLQENSVVIVVKLYPSLSEPAVDSDSDEDDDEDDGDDSEGEDSRAKNRDVRKLGLDGDEDRTSWFSWCSVL